MTKLLSVTGKGSARLRTRGGDHGARRRGAAYQHRPPAGCHLRPACHYQHRPAPAQRRRWAAKVRGSPRRSPCPNPRLPSRPWTWPPSRSSSARRALPVPFTIATRCSYGALIVRRPARPPRRVCQRLRRVRPGSSSRLPPRFAGAGGLRGRRLPATRGGGRQLHRGRRLREALGGGRGGEARPARAATQQRRLCWPPASPLGEAVTGHTMLYEREDGMLCDASRMVRRLGRRRGRFRAAALGGPGRRAARGRRGCAAGRGG